MPASPFPFQIPSIEHHANVLRRHRATADASVPGFGKTYVAGFTAQRMGLIPAVVCPKSVIGHWHDAFDQIGITPLFVTNYEQAKLTKFPHGFWEVKGRRYCWRLGNDQHLLIFDEGHRMKERTTQNSKLGIAAGRQRIPTMVLSATLAQDPLDLYTVGYLLGLHNAADFLGWCFNFGVVRGRFTFEFRGGPRALERLHSTLFPEHGCRLSYSDIPGFPDEVTDAVGVDLDQSAVRELQNVWQRIEELEQLKEDALQPITLRLRARQIAELGKIPAISELAEDVLDNGGAPILFVNFHDTMRQLEERFPRFGVIVGGQSQETRDRLIAQFRDDRLPGMICQNQAGGVGISLHDIHGHRPRTSLISPPESARDLIQVLGRTRRAGGKTPAIRRLVFANGTVEEKVRRAVEKKAQQIETINDGDLDPLNGDDLTY